MIYYFQGSKTNGPQIVNFAHTPDTRMKLIFNDASNVVGLLICTGYEYALMSLLYAQ